MHFLSPNPIPLFLLNSFMKILHLLKLFIRNVKISFHEISEMRNQEMTWNEKTAKEIKCHKMKLKKMCSGLLNAGWKKLKKTKPWTYSPISRSWFSWRPRACPTASFMLPLHCPQSVSTQFLLHWPRKLVGSFQLPDKSLFLGRAASGFVCNDAIQHQTTPPMPSLPPWVWRWFLSYSLSLQLPGAAYPTRLPALGRKIHSWLLGCPGY